MLLLALDENKFKLGSRITRYTAAMPLKLLGIWVS